MKTHTKIGNRDWVEIAEKGKELYNYLDNWGRFKHRPLFEQGFTFKLRRLILSKVPKSNKPTGQNEYRPKAKKQLTTWERLYRGI